MKKMEQKNYIKMKQEINRVAKKAYREKLVAGTSGNVSMYSREEQVMAVTPSNIDYEEMKDEDIVIMRLDGEIIEGDLKPSSEWQMHATVYANREDVNAVVHTHSPRATSFAVIKENIPVVLVEMMPFLKGDVQLSKFAYPGTKELGENALISLANRNACLLESHGVLAIGATLDQAYIRAVYVEDAAKICHYAMQIGTAEVLNDEIMTTLKKRYNIAED